MLGEIADIIDQGVDANTRRLLEYLRTRGASIP